MLARQWHEFLSSQYLERVRLPKLQWSLHKAEKELHRCKTTKNNSLVIDEDTINNVKNELNRMQQKVKYQRQILLCSNETIEQNKVLQKQAEESDAHLSRIKQKRNVVKQRLSEVKEENETLQSRMVELRKHMVRKQPEACTVDELVQQGQAY